MLYIINNLCIVKPPNISLPPSLCFLYFHHDIKHASFCCSLLRLINQREKCHFTNKVNSNGPPVELCAICSFHDVNFPRRLLHKVLGILRSSSHLHLFILGFLLCLFLLKLDLFAVLIMCSMEHPDKVL